jgi:hypothetical protein
VLPIEKGKVKTDALKGSLVAEQKGLAQRQKPPGASLQPPGAFRHWAESFRKRTFLSYISTTGR